MRALWQDLRFAARLLNKAPGFSAIVLTTVAIGIAANTTILSVADALFWQPLPVPNAERVVHIDQRLAGRDGGFVLAFADYQYFRDHSRSFEALGAHYPTSPIHLVIDGEPMAVNASVVTANYFDIVGLRPQAGRFITAGEDVARGRDAVAVISDGLWQRKFGRNPAAVGSTIHINGTPFTVIGVTPRRFAGVVMRTITTDVWIPSAMFKVGYRYCDAFAPGCRVIQMLGLLKPGVSREGAQAEMTMLAQQVESAFPETHHDYRLNVYPARGAPYPGQDGRLVRLLLAAVGALLLVACANLAGLSIARGLGRRKEIAARLALGASRWRVVRQLLTESVFLALVGGGLGVVLSFWSTDFVQRFYANDYGGRSMNVDIHISPLVLVSTVALSLVTGIVFGILPAIRIGRGDMTIVLRDEGVASGVRRAGLQRALVVLQVALSVTLMIGGALILRSLLHVYRGPGFDPSHVIVVRLRPSLVDYSVDKAIAFQHAVIDRLESLPGVLSASPSVYLPLMSWGEDVRVWRPGQAPITDDDAVRTASNRVGPRYFETLGMRFVDGRDFDESDRPGAPDAVIINDVLSHRLWPGQRATGQSIVINRREHRVVGVIADAQYYLTETEARPYLYLNYWQQPVNDRFYEDSRTHLRVAGDPAAMLASIRQAIAAIDPAVPLNEDFPLTQRIGFEFQPVRVASTMFLCFGGVAVFLSALGLYGVLAFTARHRTREIAIRLALGAERSTVMRQVLAQGAGLALMGTAAGVLAALAGARLLESLLYGVSKHDVTAFVGVPLFLAAIALAASYWPARSAASVDPATALRTE